MGEVWEAGHGITAPPSGSLTLTMQPLVLQESPWGFLTILGRVVSPFRGRETIHDFRITYPKKQAHTQTGIGAVHQGAV